MTHLQELPLSIDQFATLRKGQCLYVDKTEYLFNLLKKTSPQYFLRRPRRFGKSLTVSTFEAILQGKKELFEGLWIYDKWHWKPYSVIRLNFSEVRKMDTKEGFLNQLKKIIVKAAKFNGVMIDESCEWDESFDKLLSNLNGKGPVAILIDEYDAPFHAMIHEENELLKNVQDVLKEFYVYLKANSHSFEFLFITGITKIAKTSLFSGMNQLNDISFDSNHAALCGVTQAELESCFHDYITHLAKVSHLSRSATLTSLKRMYNGYRFSHLIETRVYNPYSLIKAFSSCEIINHWFSTGTPTLLMSLIEKTNYDLLQLETPKLFLSEASESREFSELSLNNILFQTGYLTINQVTANKKYPKKFEFNDPVLMLDFPNQEVKFSFYRFVLGSIRRKELTLEELNYGDIIHISLIKGDWDTFLKTWNKLLSEMPYLLHIELERFYQSLVYLFAKLFHIKVEAESLKSSGRVDMIFEISDKVYIIEFKLGESGKNALQQIHHKRYFESFLNKGKEIILVGMNFNKTVKVIDEIYVEDYATKHVQIFYHPDFKTS